MSNIHEFGKNAENEAVKYLRENGFTILETNWRFGRLEVDIIARKQNSLHIIEVKARSSEYFQSPKDAVTKKKQKNLFAAANVYIEKKNINLDTQFDIISVLRHFDKYKIEYIPDAFYPQVK